jgi:hypothetical protein
MRLGAGREGGDLFMADVNPLDLALSSQRVGQPIEAVADNAVDSLDAGRRKGFSELIRHRPHYPLLPKDDASASFVALEIRKRPVCRRPDSVQVGSPRSPSPGRQHKGTDSPHSPALVRGDSPVKDSIGCTSS